MDGVITDTMPYHYQAWKKVLGLNGLKISKFEIYCREGQRGIESIKDIFQSNGIKISSRFARQIILNKEILFKRIVRERYIPGARSFIKELYRSQLQLALVTGTARHEVISFLASSLLNKFSIVITGTDVSNGKPHPEPYLKALSSLNIKPSQAIVIENAPFGITSAKAAGITCFAITTSLPKSYLDKADKVFKNYTELKNFFNKNY